MRNWNNFMTETIPRISSLFCVNDVVMCPAEGGKLGWKWENKWGERVWAK